MKNAESDINKAKALLLHRIEEAYQKEISTPRDFQWLSDQLKFMGAKISPTTLKRLWGYLSDEITPRKSTLNTLSQLLGYSSFTHFTASASDEEEAASAPAFGATIHPSTQMAVNERLMLTWQPGRKCLVRHLGGGQFVVESSENTRLHAGNTFNCELIIEGEPMYIDNLVQAGRLPTGYVCGKRNGVHFLLQQ
ncbi:MAG: hypothetical protein IKX31_09025 [Muribaculaceae bacterium]|nr:hypothetical protein [Muribaculaceae bacterium]